jgi:thiol-disulfide isomerase/thioredoxin
MKQALFPSPRWVKALAIGLSFMLAMVVASPTLGRQDVPELPKPDGSGETPEMIIPMLNGGPIKLSSLRGKVVIIDFFRSTCPHCRDHAPHIVALYNQYSKRGLTILGLAGDPPEQSAGLRAYVKEMKITYPIGFITTETIAYYADSNDHGVPQMALFGSDGKMVRRWIGWSEEVGKEVLATVAGQIQKASAAKPGAKLSARNHRRAGKVQ